MEKAAERPGGAPAAAAPVDACYVCLGEDGRLLRPCDCKLYVHEECLLRLAESAAAGPCCSVCRQPLRGVEVAAEETRRVAVPSALLAGALLSGSLLAGAWFVHNAVLALIVGDGGLLLSLALLGPVCVAGSLGAWCVGRRCAVVSVETRRRAAIVPS